MSTSEKQSEIIDGPSWNVAGPNNNLSQVKGETFPPLVTKFFCPLAQLAEQVTVNHWVRGSSPRGAAILEIK
tara:strand:+ start:556 stop:771 length:216 start_codon:yes stop_codon:yes gene_type:complete